MFQKFLLPSIILLSSLTANQLKKPPGATCISGHECDSGCCTRNFLGINHCGKLSKEGEKCTDHLVDERYDYCPCELGLKCKWDGIFSHDICVDENNWSKKSEISKQIK